MFSRDSFGRHAADRDMSSAVHESEPLMSGVYTSSDPSFPYNNDKNLGTSLSTKRAMANTVNIAAPGGDPQPEMEFLRPSMAPTVESAEEILQAVEAQVEQSPLLSRRSSMSITARASRPGRSPPSPEVPVLSAAVHTATSANSGLSLPSYGSLSGSPGSRGSSLGGAQPPHGTLSWLQMQHPLSHQLAHPHQPLAGYRPAGQLPCSGSSVGPLLRDQYPSSHVQEEQRQRWSSCQGQGPHPLERQLPSTSPTDYSCQSPLEQQGLQTSVSLSAGLLGEACDAAASNIGGADLLVVAGGAGREVLAAAAMPQSAPTGGQEAVASSRHPAGVPERRTNDATTTTPFTASAGVVITGGTADLTTGGPAASWVATGKTDYRSSREDGCEPQRSYSPASVVASHPPGAGGSSAGRVQRGSASVMAPPLRMQAGGGLGASSVGLATAGGGGGGAPGGGGVPEKKIAIAGVRTWLKILPDGSASIVQLDRAQLGLQYGVQLRDFRVLDPVLGATYPSCLLCREGALIVNLDPVKVIITASFALVNHSESDKARPFIDELKRRLHNYLSSKLATPPPPQTAAVATSSAAVATSPYPLLSSARSSAAGPEGAAAGSYSSTGMESSSNVQQKSPASMLISNSSLPLAGAVGGVGGSGGASQGMGEKVVSVASLFGLLAAVGMTTGAPSVSHPPLPAPPPPASLSSSAAPPSEDQGPMAHMASALLALLPQNVRPPGLHGGHGASAADSGGGRNSSGSFARQLLPTRLWQLRRPSLTTLPQTHGSLGLLSGGGFTEGHQVSELVASMPFELRALEVVLEQTVTVLDAQTTELERATRMALDELTLRVNPRNLERMRHLKGRMAAMANKVDTVRGVLEKLLDDDRVMAAMNLTAKEEALKQQAVAVERAERTMSVAQASVLPQAGEFQMTSTTTFSPPGPPSALDPRITPQLEGGGGGVSGGGAFHGAAEGIGIGVEGWHPDSEDVAVVEMLLEAYFMQLGHTWQRLQSLKSYIDSTEDLINLELDQQRNNLISVDLMVTFGSFLLTAMSVIAGLFGMNVTNHMESDYSAFLAICMGSAAAAVSLWLLFVYGSIRYGLMNGLSMTWR